LADLDKIIPFGYTAMQFLNSVKNEIQILAAAYKSEHNLNYQNMTPEQIDQASRLPGFEDSGLVEENGAIVEKYFPYAYHFDPVSGMWLQVKVTDTIYNSIRRLLKDGNLMSIRWYSPPKAGRTKGRSMLNNNDPQVEINKFGYNPALERRLHLKLHED
jgi:hypothetical protein